VSVPDLSSPPRHVHLIGIGGAGMSAIATVLIGMGHEVSGSDLKDGVALERLRGLGAGVTVGHSADNISGADLIASSTAVAVTNVERIAAQERGIELVSRAELLAAICRLRRTVAVSGTHGKTTTSSMLALMLIEAGFDPSFIVGGDINEIGANAAWDDGRWLVVEADESDGTFLLLDKEIAVVTSVEPDHLNYYGRFSELEEAFRRFSRECESCLVSADDELAASLAPPSARTFGFATGADLSVRDFAPARTSSRFTLSGKDGATIDCKLPVPGRHNARNAAAAASAALRIGADRASIAAALARFGGVSRRFEFRGEVNGALVVDDYAHLPSEVAAALETARSGGFARTVCVFQPHRYTRIEALGATFADAFVGADVLFVTDIYGAGEAPRPGVSGLRVADAVSAAHPEADVRYQPDQRRLVAELAAELRSGDCCLVLGACDVTVVSAELLALREAS
jgi:UDP-N-acetylmuramate--alanine ligase